MGLLQGEVSYGVFRAAEKMIEERDIGTLFGIPLVVVLEGGESCRGFFIEHKGDRLRMLTKEGKGSACIRELAANSIEKVDLMSQDDPFRERIKFEHLLKDVVPNLFS